MQQQDINHNQINQMSICEAEKKAIEIAKQHSEQNFVITYQYKGDIIVSKIGFGQGIRVFFTPTGKQGGNFQFLGGSSPLGDKSSLETFKTEIEGVFFKQPILLQKDLGFSLSVVNGSAKFLLFENRVNVGSFHGGIIGSKFNTNSLGLGLFNQLFLLEQLKNTIKNYQNTDSEFYKANKHILQIKTPEQYIVSLSIPQKISFGYTINALIRQASSIGRLGGKTFYFSAGDFLPVRPTQWQQSPTALKLRGFFLVNPDELPKEVGYSVNIVDHKVQLHFFIGKQLKGVFTGSSKSDARSYSGEGWFERQGSVSKQN